MPKNSGCTVLDYGVGNIYSVLQSLKQTGVTPTLTSDPQKLKSADRVIVPGVGAFQKGLEGLFRNNLIEALLEFAQSGRPILGICLGMQLFGTRSLEFGERNGLNLIPGQIQKIPSRTERDEHRLVPYIGWRDLKLNAESTQSLPILQNINEIKSVYFVHSYQFIVENPKHLIATYEYGGLEITAAVQKDNITGLQFHPEKSGPTGLQILKAFTSN